MDAGRAHQSQGNGHPSSPLKHHENSEGIKKLPSTVAGSSSPSRSMFIRSPLRNQKGETVYEAVNRIKKNLPSQTQENVETRRSRSRERRKPPIPDASQISNLEKNIDAIQGQVKQPTVKQNGVTSVQAHQMANEVVKMNSPSGGSLESTPSVAMQRTVASGHFIPISAPSMQSPDSAMPENGVIHTNPAAHVSTHISSKYVNTLSSVVSPKTYSQYSDSENSTIEKQRVELQLLMGELKDRDRELNEMVTAHQQQMTSCEKDREKYQALVEKCNRREEEIQNRNTQIRGLVKKIRILESGDQSRLTELESTKKQLSRMVDQHTQAQQRIVELQESVLKQNHSFKDMSSAIGRLEAREEELSTLIKLKDKDIVESQKELSEVKIRVRKLESDLRTAQQKDLETQHQSNNWQRKYQSACKETERLKVNLNQSQQDESQSQETLEKQRQEIQNLRKQLALADERDRRKDELIESQRLKQDRTDKELTDLRQLYERQQEDLSQLHLNLESTKQLLNQNFSPRFHDSTFELLEDLSVLGASFHSVNYGDSFSTSPNISSSSVIHRAGTSHSHNTSNSSIGTMTHKLGSPAGSMQAVPTHSTPIRHFTASRTTQLIKPTPQKAPVVGINSSPCTLSSPLVKPVLQKVPNSVANSSINSPSQSRESSVLSGSGHSASSPWVKPAASGGSGTLDWHCLEATSHDVASMQCQQSRSAVLAAEQSPPAQYMKKSSLSAILQKSPRALSLMQEIEIANKQRELDSQPSEQHTADNKYYSSPKYGVSTQNSSLISNTQNLTKQGLSQDETPLNQSDAYDSFIRRSRSPVESCDNSTLSNADTSASLKDFEAVERECASPTKQFHGLSQVQDSRTSSVNSFSVMTSKSVLESTSNTASGLKNLSDKIVTTISSGTIGERNPEMPASQAADVSPDFAPSSYSQFAIAGMGPGPLSGVNQNNIGSRSLTSIKCDKKLSAPPTSSIAVTESSREPDSLSSAATMEMHSLLSDSVPPTPSSLASPQLHSESPEQVRANNLSSNYNSLGRSCFSLYSEPSLDASINSCGHDNISVHDCEDNENNNNDTRLIHGSIEVYKAVNTSSGTHDVNIESTGNCTSGNKVGWPVIGPTAFNVGPMSPSPALPSEMMRQTENDNGHIILMKKGKHDSEHAAMATNDKSSNNKSNGRSPLKPGNLSQFNANINTEYDEKAGIYVNRDVDLPTPSTLETMSPDSISIDVSLDNSGESDSPTSKLQQLLSESREMAACLQQAYQSAPFPPPDPQS